MTNQLKEVKCQGKGCGHVLFSSLDSRTKESHPDYL